MATVTGSDDGGAAWSPCLSAFRPVYLGGVGLPAELDLGSGAYDEGSPWWRFERLQRLELAAERVEESRRHCPGSSVAIA